MKQYLEVGAMASNMFSTPVPIHAWDEQVSRELIVYVGLSIPATLWLIVLK